MPDTDKVIARARDRVRYAQKVGKTPRPGDLATLARWRATTRPDRQDAGPTRSDPEAVSVTSGENASSGAVPPPSSTDAGLGGAIPELPAPDVSQAGAVPDGERAPEGGESAPGAPAQAVPPATGSAPAPDAAGALPALYRGMLVGLNDAARTRGCWFTLPEASIDVLTAYAAEVLAPYESMINKPALVLGAPVVLGVQILVHDGQAKKRKAAAERAARGEPEPAPPMQRPETAAQPDAVPAPPSDRVPDTATFRGPAGWAG